MQQHVRENGLSEKPRRLLVGGMKARKLLLASPCYNGIYSTASK